MQPRPAQPHTTPSQTLFTLLYGENNGYLELCYIVGDPSDRSERLRREGWYWYTPQRSAALAQRVARLAARFGDVYVSSTLYSSPRRNQADALPSRVVFLDDAPARDDYSLSIRTSGNSRHAYYLLDQPIDPQIRAELQRRAAYALGTDKSGADVTQVVRVPGSYNTKHGRRYAVQIESTSRAYTLAELQRRWPEVSPRSQAAHTEAWANQLANVDHLLTADGLPRRLGRNTQAYKLLTGALTVPDRSLARAFICNGLIQHGYPDDEIAALLIHLCDYGHSQQKGSTWLYEDIARLIGIYRAKHPRVQVTPSGQRQPRAVQPLPQIQPARRARHDRPHKIDAPGLLRWYEQQIDAAGVVLLTKAETAHELQVSVATLERLERQLRSDGQIERRTSADRRRSWVVVLGAININQKHHEAYLHVDVTEDRSAAGESQDQKRLLKEVHTPARAPRRNSPRALVAEAMSAITGRLSLKRVQWYLSANYPDAPLTERQITTLYQQEKQRRHQEQRHAAMMERIGRMKIHELRRAMRSAEMQIGQSHAKQTKAYKFWSLYRDRCATEIQRRARTGTRPARPMSPIGDTTGAAGGCVPPQSSNEEEQTQRSTEQACEGRSHTGPTPAPQESAQPQDQEHVSAHAVQRRALLPGIRPRARVVAIAAVEPLPPSQVPHPLPARTYVDLTDPWVQHQIRGLRQAQEQGNTERAAFFLRVLGGTLPDVQQHVS